MIGLQNSDKGKAMYDLIKRLFPICRSITGQGVRDTLAILKEELPELTVTEVPSGSNAFDWEIPNEWNIKDAYILTPDGEKIANFQENNLHIVNYSTPIKKKLSLDELQEHLYSIPDQPEAVPYITSYYTPRWGFCLSHFQRESLKEGEYEVCIDSTLEPGSLTYGELLIPGESKKEILLSTYICHPSMANNELSGPAVACFLAKWLTGLSKRRYSYRIVFAPETIGHITYISRNLDALREKVFAGFNITCVGDDNAYSYLPSKYGNSISDQAALHVLNHIAPDFKKYSFLERGSDERQYNSQGINLPIASICRTKYGEYPEYHTSLDNLDFVSSQGLFGGFYALQKAITCIEHNIIPRANVICEPRLVKYSLFNGVGTKVRNMDAENILNLITYADGTNNLLEIAEYIEKPFWDLYEICKMLEGYGILSIEE